MFGYLGAKAVSQSGEKRVSCMVFGRKGRMLDIVLMEPMIVVEEATRADVPGS